MRMLKQSQKRTKRAALRWLSCPAPGQHHRLIGDDTDRVALHPAQSRSRCFRHSPGWISKKSPSSTDLLDQFLDVVGLVGLAGIRVSSEWSGGSPSSSGAHGAVLGLDAGRKSISGASAAGPRRHSQAPCRQPGFAHGYRCTAQVPRGHVFMGDGLHHVRAGDEHVAGVLHHER